MNDNKLQIKQLDRRIRVFSAAKEVPPPPTGWIKAIRTSLDMTLQQLADKLAISRQSVHAMELREKEGNMSLKTLQEVAEALDMHLVYALIPREGSLDQYIDRKARKLAEQIVSRTSHSMKLEDQEPSQARIEEAIEERAAILKHELPKILWD